jgi:PPK2 family polyphosphate:nucleotide phosphotransferase
MGKMLSDLIATPGSKHRVQDFDPADTLGWDKEKALGAIEANRERLGELHELLWAENKHTILLVLQGMDTSGKDGTIRHVMTGVNPQGCHVTSFKQPTEEEADHDYLWRIVRALPARGDIGIFNRSHYEDVLIVRVHDLVPKDTWKARYAQINTFEKHLTDNGTVLLKFFLNISKEEQRQRLQERLDDPTKNWKFSEGDLAERKHWQDYMEAYSDILTKCSTDNAPWYVIPSDRKWVRNLAISTVLAKALEGLDMRWPKPRFDPKSITIE